MQLGNKSRPRSLSAPSVHDVQEVPGALYESEKRLRALVTASSDAIYRMSADWSEMRQMKGNFQNREFLVESEESNQNWLQDYIHPDDQLRVWTEIQDAIREKTVFELEHRVRQVDGSLGWTHSRAVPVFDDNGEIAEWFGMASDITASKQAATALMQTEKLAAMGRLAASIAHEVNNPLESVTNLIYLARASDSLEASREYLDTADRELRRASAITSQTLRFYKQSTDSIKVSSGDLIDGVLLIHHRRIVNSHVKLVRRLRARRNIRCFDGEITAIASKLSELRMLSPVKVVLYRHDESCNPNLGRGCSSRRVYTNLRRAALAIPSSPVPSRARLEGSGVTATGPPPT